ncbi:hypothetical protein Nepgr_009767 [Nepenthes gracilis]|uniref:Uncharacterized protein n=1 Tax=Nepenthes gracilis TaxID=150966 RepID=A0AAD3SBC4_NEPGR|nr:hypothetical protein Nepgr_009767 [Nepenthes gracilis]
MAAPPTAVRSSGATPHADVPLPHFEVEVFVVLSREAQPSETLRDVAGKIASRWRIRGPLDEVLKGRPEAGEARMPRKESGCCLSPVDGVSFATAAASIRPPSNYDVWWPWVSTFACLTATDQARAGLPLSSFPVSADLLHSASAAGGTLAVNESF